MAAFKQRVMTAVSSNSYVRHPSGHQSNRHAEILFKRPHNFGSYRSNHAQRHSIRDRIRRNVRSYQYESNRISYSQPNYYDSYNNRIYSRNSRSSYTPQNPSRRQRTLIHPPIYQPNLSPIYQPNHSPIYQPNHPPIHPPVNPSICPAKVERVLCRLPKCYF